MKFKVYAKPNHYIDVLCRRCDSSDGADRNARQHNYARTKCHYRPW